MSLTTKAVKTARRRKKDYKIFDGEGLYLLVKAKGGKYWRFKYRLAGKERLRALGVFPDVSLSAARKAKKEIRRILATAKVAGRIAKAFQGWGFSDEKISILLSSAGLPISKGKRK